MQINVKKLAPSATLPTYATDGSGCFDIYAHFDNPDSGYAIAHPGTPAVIDTKLAFKVPEGYAMLIFSRSGHGFKQDVRLANCVGVLDSDYIGELKVKLTNDNGDGNGLTIRHGDRIAQAAIVPMPKVTFAEVEELEPTVRGTGGFGSTGQ